MGLVPEYIGPYRVLRPIAAGGMAEVYEVQDPASGERLALKLLVAVRAALKRFNREYEAMTRLNHPNIVRVYHYGLHQGHPWLTMELLRGMPAQSHAKRVGRPGTPHRLREVLRIGYHVAKALHYIHDRKLVHRDLKSANVLVLPDDRVKLLDFGAAHLIDGDRITQEGEFVGTFAYAAPEQLLGQALDARTDLYSLGVLLYRLVTGRRPFGAKDPEELARQHLKQAPPDPRRYAENTPDALADLIHALLAKRPDDRPVHADHVAQQLEAMHGRPFSSRSRLAVHNQASAARETERRKIWDHLEEGPASTLAIVEGDDGSDRVRFLETIRADAAERGWGAYECSMQRSGSLQRLVEALVTLGEDCSGAEAEPHVDALKRAASPEALANGRERAVLRQSAAALARLRAPVGSPTVLCVQEVHRADPLALEVLGGLRRALQSDEAPFKIVVSSASAELDGDSELHRRLGEALRVKLEPLTPREVAVAVGTMLGRRPPPAELARKLHQVTAGQPLYVEQAVQVMVAGRGIEAEGSRLAWADQAMDVPGPARARSRAEKVLETLPVTWRRVLEALALADDASEPSILARALEWPIQELAAVLHGMSAKGIVAWDVASSIKVALRHPLLGTIVAERIHPCRLAVLRRNIAGAVRGLPPTRGGLSAMVAVGRLGEAARGAVALARELLAAHRIRSALEVLEPVLAGVRDTDRGTDFAEAYLAYARCLRTIRPTDAASAKSLARARELADADGALLARIDLAQARLYKVIGHYGNFRKYLKQAWERTRTDQHRLRAPIATELARSYRWHGDIPKAEQWVEQALQAAEVSEDSSVLGDGILQSAACMLARGHLDDAEQAFSLAMTEFERGSNRAGFWRALARWAGALRLQGRYSEALSQLYQRLPDASQSQDPTPYVELLLATAWVELDLSRLGRAQECTDELAATVHRGEHLHLRLETQLLNGRIQLLSGQYRNAAYVLQEVHRGARSAELPVLSEQARAYLAETMYALGDRDAAASMFQSAILGLLGSGDLTMLAEGIRGRARTQSNDKDPTEIFKPVARLVEEEPMALLRLEQLLARGAWHRAKGERELARHAFREAAMVLNRIATGLNDTDRAALRVHPWSTWIRKGLL